MRHRLLGIVVGVAAGMAGCSEPAPERPMVDAEHSHYHVHSPDIDHGHVHSDFVSGGHSHPHEHTPPEGTD